MLQPGDLWYHENQQRFWEGMCSTETVSKLVNIRYLCGDYHPREQQHVCMNGVGGGGEKLRLPQMGEREMYFSVVPSSPIPLPTNVKLLWSSEVLQRKGDRA